MLAHKSTLQWKWGRDSMEQSYIPLSEFIWSEEYIKRSFVCNSVSWYSHF